MSFSVNNQNLIGRAPLVALNPEEKASESTNDEGDDQDYDEVHVLNIRQKISFYNKILHYGAFLFGE